MKLYIIWEANIYIISIYIFICIYVYSKQKTQSLEKIKQNILSLVILCIAQGNLISELT